MIMTPNFSIPGFNLSLLIYFDSFIYHNWIILEIIYIYQLV